ncbi:1-deoxy-D-xylulose-5-phosphate synthase [Hymenobacter setariae]|uniref:1-deoxy-D-xylulose-5-phosphate synthase n=1 Tax=Hymenobacter setariae TaxID=2594794 RepID=A0A558BYB5_9BACT|nr:1-deoxy-D-xylulose-5-phosphate synthase [Hymenobacter setariae]TVT41506.1 1-deoxy-D-xylulose-5-phosphate synthase [Hymenobacter setariae]
MMIEPGPLLAAIASPDDLKKLAPEQLVQVSAELREFIIDTVSIYGGHFGASLGVVELTVALHYVFNTPYDQLVWDVGHQAYGHKILTGRRDRFPTNRRYGGMSGFPKRSESEYDAFGVGHSSTSIGAALGMSVASDYKKEFDRQHIAVIGDGSMTAGMSFEALNQAGALNNNMIVVLNDNCMSIDPNVGALKEYLTDITTSRTYNKVRDELWNVLGKLSKFGPNPQQIARKVEAAMKATLLKQSNLFEALNFRYFGPVDGHDVQHLVAVFNDLKAIPGPKLLHCVTVKGKGYALAEKDQTLWHAPGLFDKITGEIFTKIPDKPQPPKYQDVFGHTLLELAQANDKIMGVTPAMPSGSSLNIMMAAMPDRAFDVGIAEQHAVTFSAGMATQGLVPFCNIYSSFMQRGYDQVVHDVALQNLHVVFCLDRAGFAGADGPTHHGCYDLAYMRCIPNIVVAAPMNEQELRNLMYTAQLPENAGPFSIRYPRGEGVMPEWRTPLQRIAIGTGRVVREGEAGGVAILSIGHIGNYAVQATAALAAEGLDVGHYDMRFCKPLDEEMLLAIARSYRAIVTVEDGCLQGGFGSAVLEFLADQGQHLAVRRLGIPDRVVEHGTQDQLYKECGFDASGIANAVRELSNKIATAVRKTVVS